MIRLLSGVHPALGAAVSAAVVVLVLVACGGSLAPHADLLVSGRQAQTASVAKAGVRVTYLGCNGFVLQSGGTTLLVDPCFTRPGLLKVGFGRLAPNQDVVDSVLAKLPKRVDGILVTHAHYDHLLDVPAVHKRTGGRLLASPTGCYLAVAAEVPVTEVVPVLPGAVRTIGKAKITVLEAAHDRLFGLVPYPGVLTAPPERAPRRASDYVCGQPLAFLIEMGGQTIYVDSGGTPEVLPPEVPGGVDLAILGAAVKDSRERFIPAVRRLKPRFVFPSHQDNFFRPIDKAYRFAATANFPALRREFEESGAPGELVLFDFFDAMELR